eukprot:scaffold7863_cov118-Isochrysis_galbana.AAC.11
MFLPAQPTRPHTPRSAYGAPEPHPPHHDGSRNHAHAPPHPTTYACADALPPGNRQVGTHPNDTEGKRALILSYLEGLVWCMEYYHNGCRSWDWCALALLRARLRIPAGLSACSAGMVTGGCYALLTASDWLLSPSLFPAFGARRCPSTNL